MGHHYSSGTQWVVITQKHIFLLLLTKMIQLILASCLVALAVGDADPHVFYHAPALLNAYPNWPGVRAPGFSSTCYGCYGKKKRSADAEPHGFYGVAPYYRPFVGFVPRVVAPGVAGHGGGATSYVAGSGPGIGKRSADPEPQSLLPAVYHALPAYSVRGISQLHAGGGHSFQHYALGKRSADPEPAFQNYGYPYALAHHVVPGTAYGIN